MPHPLRRTLLPVALILIGGWCAVAHAREGRPNIIVILSDDQGYADVGVQGCRDIPTPHLDAMARAGVQCTDGYVTCPVCAPTRAGLLSGRYQQRSGFEDNAWNRNAGLAVEVPTMADYLKSAGYSTLAIGKWHIGQLPQYRPLRRGFTDHYGFLGGGRSYMPLKESVGVPFVPKDPDMVDLWRNEERVEDPAYLTSAFGDEAVSYIEQHKQDPFFIYLAFNAVHVPLQAEETDLDKFPSLSGARRTYAAMLTSMDEAIGRIQEKLAEEKLEQETLIFFLSDNGGHPMANAARNDPLRGQKGTVFEGGIRVPFFVQWTGHLPAGTKYSQPVVSLDIMATALAQAGITPQAEFPLDGVNLIPFLCGERSDAPHDVLFWRYVDAGAVRQGSWKLTMPAGEPSGLYNLSEDIAETRDLSDAEPDRRAQLEQLYQEWVAELPAPPKRSGPGARARQQRRNSPDTPAP